MYVNKYLNISMCFMQIDRVVYRYNYIQIDRMIDYADQVLVNKVLGKV